jgi:hypothetical protein
MPPITSDVVADDEISQAEQSGKYLTNNNNDSGSYSLIFHSANVELFMKYVHQQIKDDELSSNDKNIICKIMDLVNYSNTTHIYTT